MAIIDKSDQNHSRASQYYKQQTKAGTIWATSDYILDESITRIRYNIRHHKAVDAIKLFDQAKNLGLLRVIKIDDRPWVCVKFVGGLNQQGRFSDDGFCIIIVGFI
ncbi:MAG: hypothetical protein HYR55_11040 [Acidobacteria bacterium]|nr:hypothetical protein [Acidobacteriota bacterium]MBI3657713.1 hypothetical protein [Acidobacteriota bacterium]